MPYAPVKKYEQFEFRDADAAEDELAVSLRIRRSLSGDELRHLEVVIPANLRDFTAAMTYPVIAEHIDSWNVKAIDTATNKVVAVPVPTPEQYDQLGLLPDAIVFALFGRLRSGPQRRVDEQAKNS